MGRSKYWCFTLNNYSDELYESILQLYPLEADYLIVGKEVGESGTPHLQGYLELSTRRRLGAMRKLVDRRVHWEVRRGSAEQARDYCKKENDFVEKGTLRESKQGKRNDLEQVKLAIDEGKSRLEVAENFFGQWCRYRKSFDAYCRLRVGKEHRKELRVLFLYGEAGCGKTRLAYELFPDLFRVPSATLQWFDGYQQERAVLIDDYRGQGDSSFLLQLLDIYPMQVPVKGGFEPWVPLYIIITSNMELPLGHMDIEEPLRRRIHKSFHFSGTLNFDDREAVDRVVGTLGLGELFSE